MKELAAQTRQPAARRLAPLPATFARTRESLRALACYVLAPARLAAAGRIELTSTGDGFGTPPLPGGGRLVVRGATLAMEPGPPAVPITTVRAAAGHTGVELSPDPGVGRDLPPFTPDAELLVDEASSAALGAWYALAQEVLDGLRAEDTRLAEPHLWPEHFDLAVATDTGTVGGANLGFSPGDRHSPDPYVYAAPFDTEGLEGDYWNAPFGATLGYEGLLAATDPAAAATGFLREGLARLGRAPGTAHAVSSGTDGFGRVHAAPRLNRRDGLEGPAGHGRGAP